MTVEREDQSRLPLSTVVGLAVVIIAWWFIQEPLKSGRPEGDRLGSKEEAIQARLWQDPIETVQKGNGIENLWDTPLGFNNVHNDQHIGILIIITEGGPYSENHEKRLRNRYAVVSALGTACFFPKDSEHIGVYKSVEMHTLVPFEWYKIRSIQDHCHDVTFRHYDGVLVLWATKSMLGEEPLKMLHAFSTEIVKHYRDVECGSSPTWDCISKIEMKIIGPPDSDSLRTMLREAKEGKTQWYSQNYEDLYSLDHTIELYSPWATASPELLIAESGEISQSDQSRDKTQLLKTYLSRAGIKLEYAVISDNELSTALVQELIRRQVNLETDRIALVSEWDTFYGRALPLAFETAVCAAVMPNSCRSSSDSRDRSKIGKIQRYSYLQGLDGLTPQDTKRKEENDESKKSHNSVKEVLTQAEHLRELERSDGQSQLDYVRRLVDTIKKDADKYAHDEGTPIKAIGILGNDIHDTLLILQALRQEYPSAIFFTTNLDARLLDESNYKWTRNVVVASPFGLELHREIQRETPPFRDSYQTSTFFAILRAIGHIRQSGTSPNIKFGCMTTQQLMSPPSDLYKIDLVKNAVPGRLCPRLFEVGRHGEVDLSSDKTMMEHGTTVTIQPVRELQPAWKRIAFFEVAVLIICALFTRAIARINRFIDEPDKLPNDKKKQIVRLSVGLLSLVAICPLIVPWIATSWDGWEGEPFTLTDGVSTWPAIGMRLSVILWCTGSLIFACYYVQRESSDLDVQRNKDQPTSLQEDMSALMKLKTTMLGAQWSIKWVMSIPTMAECSISDVYAEYLKAGRLRNRLLRTIVLTIAYLIFASITLQVFDFSSPWANPCRGNFNCALVNFSLISVAFLIFLNMFVFDDVLLCQRYVAQLIGKTDWPSQVTIPTWWIDRKFIVDLLTVRHVAELTQAVHKLTFTPFIALLLMVGSRSRLFDGWDFPPALIVIWTIYVMLALLSMVRLKSTANSVREAALINLNKLLMTVMGEAKPSKHNPEQIRLIIEEVKGMREGAYAPFLQHPVFGTSLLTVIAILQYWLLGS